MKIVNGDILTPVKNPEKEMVVVCHQVNCKGVMGKGLARRIKNRFPGVFELYRERCDALGSKNLGTVQLCSCFLSSGYVIANIFGQDRYGKEKRFTDYNALKKAFSSMSHMENTVIRIPYKMGCGLGGGDWSIVKSLIRSELVDKGCRVEIWHKDTLSFKSKRGVIA